ncbi:MAG: IgGFc-binding protein [bacterium]
MFDKAKSFGWIAASLVLCALAGLWSCDDGETGGGGGADASVEVDAAGPACELGARRCGDDGIPEQCLDPGGWVDRDACPEGDVCVEGECTLPTICEPNASRCRDEQTLEVCNAIGTAWEPSRCDRECRPTADGAVCEDVECVPGQLSCLDTQVVQRCNDSGTGFVFDSRCNGARTGQECNRGECVPICELNKKTKTNVGCDYWAVDLDNAFVPGGETGFLDAAAKPFAVVVSNPHPDFTAEVSVYNNEELVQSAVVPPLGLHVFLLPRRDVDGTVLAARAYRVRSSIPIVAYQFNPLDNEEVFSNDASLLLPSHVVGQEYYVMTREQSFDRLRGYLTVVAIDPEDGEDPSTEVTVRVTARTQAGVGGIQAMEPGDEITVTMQPFDVLSIQTAAPGADLTGSYVTASKNVVVFGGSEAANVPNTNHCIDIDPVTREGVCEYKPDEPCRTNYDCNEARLNTCCADHLEQQLFPVNTWQRHYIATKSFDRGLESDYWRILASEDDTKIETVPPQVPIPTLNAGEWFEFGSRERSRS